MTRLAHAATPPLLQLFDKRLLLRSVACVRTTELNFLKKSNKQAAGSTKESTWYLSTYRHKNKENV